MEALFIAINAVVPFLCYMMYGYGFRRLGFADIPFFNRLNQLVFKAFFTILMFKNFYSMDLDFGAQARFVGFIVAALLLLIFLLFLLVPLLVSDNRKKGVIIQGVYRSNTLIFAIPLAEAIFGEEGANLATVAVAFCIPIYNLSAIIILEYFNGGKSSAWDLIKRVVTNPLILGSILGAVCLGLHIEIPECFMTPIRNFANMSTPLAIFILGGTIQFLAIGKNLKYIVPTLLAKLFVVPAVLMLIAGAFGFGPMERFVVLCVFGTPDAAAMFPMSQNLGGDGELAGQLLATSTIFSVVSLFLWIYALKATGLI
jgi:predicted permease